MLKWLGLQNIYLKIKTNINIIAKENIIENDITIQELKINYYRKILLMREISFFLY